jgi:hypothetical protein
MYNPQNQMYTFCDNPKHDKYHVCKMKQYTIDEITSIQKYKIRQRG